MAYTTEQLQAMIKDGTLYLGGNKIVDLSPLSGMTNLTWLYLGGNQISDLNPLAGLTNLTTLDLAGNQISDAAVDALRAAIPDLTIYR